MLSTWNVNKPLPLLYSKSFSGRSLLLNGFLNNSANCAAISSLSNSVLFVLFSASTTYQFLPSVFLYSYQNLFSSLNQFGSTDRLEAIFSIFCVVNFSASSKLAFCALMGGAGINRNKIGMINFGMCILFSPPPFLDAMQVIWHHKELEIAISGKTSFVVGAGLQPGPTFANILRSSFCQSCHFVNS